QASATERAALGTGVNAAPLQSLNSVSRSITPSAPAPLAALALAGATNPLDHSTRLQPYARRIDAARVFARLLKPEMSVNSVAALFPPALVGKTFEWDFTALQYDTPHRTGATS